MLHNMQDNATFANALTRAREKMSDTLNMAAYWGKFPIFPNG